MIAIIFVAARAYQTRAAGRFDKYLTLALVLSLCGDVFLMLPGNYFIPGLASFLVAHLFYIAVFRQGQHWFPNRTALLATLSVGACMYLVLWPGLGAPALKVAVAAYVSVIALMAAQALGRARNLGTPQAHWVAVGACIFMVSDALIAVNKFLAPVPLASLWVLSTYYAAQMLIVHFARPPNRKQHTLNQCKADWYLIAPYSSFRIRYPKFPKCHVALDYPFFCRRPPDGYSRNLAGKAGARRHAGLHPEWQSGARAAH